MKRIVCNSVKKIKISFLVSVINPLIEKKTIRKVKMLQVFL